MQLRHRFRLSSSSVRLEIVWVRSGDLIINQYCNSHKQLSGHDDINADLSVVLCSAARQSQSQRTSDPAELQEVRPQGRDTAKRSCVGGCPCTRGQKEAHTCRYGCFNASLTSIRRLGENVRHFSIRSRACFFH